MPLYQNQRSADNNGLNTFHYHNWLLILGGAIGREKADDEDDQDNGLMMVSRWEKKTIRRSPDGSPGLQRHHWSPSRLPILSSSFNSVLIPPCFSKIYMLSRVPKFNQISRRNILPSEFGSPRPHSKPASRGAGRLSC